MIALLVSLFFLCWNAGVAKFIVPQVHHRHRLHLHLPTFPNSQVQAAVAGALRNLSELDEVAADTLTYLLTYQLINLLT